MEGWQTIRTVGINQIRFLAFDSGVIAVEMMISLQSSPLTKSAAHSAGLCVRVPRGVEVRCRWRGDEYPGPIPTSVLK